MKNSETPPYKEMYNKLFNAITDALGEMKFDAKAREILMDAQLKTEEIYINAPEA